MCGTAPVLVPPVSVPSADPSRFSILEALKLSGFVYALSCPRKSRSSLVPVERLDEPLLRPLALGELFDCSNLTGCWSGRVAGLARRLCAAFRAGVGVRVGVGRVRSRSGFEVCSGFDVDVEGAAVARLRYACVDEDEGEDEDVRMNVDGEGGGEADAESQNDDDGSECAPGGDVKVARFELAPEDLQWDVPAIAWDETIGRVCISYSVDTRRGSWCLTLRRGADAVSRTDVDNLGFLRDMGSRVCTGRGGDRLGWIGMDGTEPRSLVYCALCVVCM
ncbi:hypothetical protein L226DRAFT_275983 [Lentinus tigrinus ALCF2SS1-7]|uniref:uncharacterized protein n=1 Tax=Lentinus tigrinus ALCF2SS1-7 TaxID=1328758 RepID=UPI001165FBD2|nr:hypothetical protein L226DRAFT_275983 [Lentinus tigrinus ALCF2SS1-7]